MAAGALVLMYATLRYGGEAESADGPEQAENQTRPEGHSGTEG